MYLTFTPVEGRYLVSSDMRNQLLLRRATRNRSLQIGRICTLVLAVFTSDANSLNDSDCTLYDSSAQQWRHTPRTRVQSPGAGVAELGRG